MSRHDCRYRTDGGPRFVHTLNGTAIAMGRALIAIVENVQRADGTVAVPPVLMPFLGKQTVGVFDVQEALKVVEGRRDAPVGTCHQQGVHGWEVSQDEHAILPRSPWVSLFIVRNSRRQLLSREFTWAERGRRAWHRA